MAQPAAPGSLFSMLTARLKSFLDAESSKSASSSSPEPELSRLKELSLLIDLALSETDKRPVRNDDLKQWLVDLRAVSDDAKDLLDSYDQELAKAVDDDAKAGSRKSSSIPSFIAGSVAAVTSLFRDGSKISQLRATVAALERKASHLQEFLTLVYMGSCSSSQVELENSEVSGMESQSSHSGPVMGAADNHGSVHCSSYSSRPRSAFGVAAQRRRFRYHKGRHASSSCARSAVDIAKQFTRIKRRRMPHGSVVDEHASCAGHEENPPSKRHQGD